MTMLCIYKFRLNKNFDQKKQEQFLEFANLSNFSFDTEKSHIMGHFGTNSCMYSSMMISYRQ